MRARIEELTTLIGDLVELARDEPLTHVVEAIDLSEVVEQAVARVRRRAPGIEFDVETRPWWVVGEPAGLERAVADLLDNAAKWSPPNGAVQVRLTGGALTVDDEGTRHHSRRPAPRLRPPLLPVQESRSMPGSGLGLSIVRQVAVRHSGQVVAGGWPARRRTAHPVAARPRAPSRAEGPFQGQPSGRA